MAVRIVRLGSPRGVPKAEFAALSHRTDFAVGCYCEHEEHCHRSVLRELLDERGARIV